MGIKQNVNQSTLSRANEKRDWRIFADFGEYLIKMVRPLYANCSIPNIYIDNDVFALDSTTISVIIRLFHWAEGKYHDSNILDVIVPQPGAIYLMDKAYIDFAALNELHESGAFFVTRAKVTLDYQLCESSYNIDQTTGLRSDRIITLSGYKSKSCIRRSFNW